MTNKLATPPQWVIKRAGGRRRYNSQRQRAAQRRMNEVYRLWLLGMPRAEIARWLGVHRSTITRDVQQIEYLQSMGKRGKRHSKARRLVLRYTGMF